MDLRDWFAVALIAATVVRIVASIVAGTIEAARSGARFGPGGKAHAGEVILDFARFGDGVGALLVVALTGLLYWRLHIGTRWYVGRRLALLGTALAGAVAVAGLAEVVGYVLYLSDQERVAASIAAVVGEGLSYTIIAMAAAVAMYRLTWQIDEQLVAEAPPEQGAQPA